MTITIKVDGMSCSHCENTVKKAVLNIKGVWEVSVDLKSKAVTIQCTDDVKIEKINQTIEDIGYTVI